MKEDNNDIVNQKSNEIINGKGEAKEDDNSKDIVLQNLLSKNGKFKEIFMLIGNNSNTIEAKKRKKGNKEKNDKSKTIDVNQKRITYNLDEEIEQLKKKKFSNYNNSKESSNTNNNNSNSGIQGKIAVLFNEINLLNIEKANNRIVNQKVHHRIKNDNTIPPRTKKIKSFFIMPKGKEDFSFNIKKRKNLNSWIVSEKELQGNTFLHSKKNEIKNILSLTKQTNKNLSFFRNNSKSHFNNDYYMNELDKFSFKLKQVSSKPSNENKTKKYVLFNS